MKYEKIEDLLVEEFSEYQLIIYDPDMKPIENMSADQYKDNKGTSINHFYEKLLLLKDLMNTESAKRIAKNRHEYMKYYLEEFYDEWEGKQ